ncbi:MAG: endonuclease/exonuclease/phosphatase family protein [Phycisphaerales bacterium]
MARSRTRVSTPLALVVIFPALSASAQPTPIVLDGDLHDWDARPALVASAEHLYLRFAPGSDVTLQGGQRTTHILLDLDADAATGQAFSTDNPLGVDLEIQISPPPDEIGAELSTGVRAWVYIADGRLPLSHTDIGVAFAPTYAADAYELRLDRDAAVLASFSKADRVRGLVVQTDENGKELWRSDPFEGVLDPPAITDPPVGGGPVPHAPPGAIRVLSHNVLHTRPGESPDAFARLYHALAPDVILLQEWDDWSAEKLVAWFDEHVPIDGGWHAVAHPGERAGVAVVSRFPITLAVDEPIHAEGVSWPVRFVAAVVDAPGGPLLAGSIHLKCCGYAGSSEDEQRQDEARAINALVKRVLDEHDLARCVMGGDLNLVGSRPPLDLLRANLDADATDLEPARTLIWGDAAALTWTDDHSAFSPGRLDWIVYSDAVFENPFACVVETERLTPDALAKMGLEREDSRASDHMPVVVDLTPSE